MNPKTVGALGIVYVVWGSTYLAIRYAIEGFPPLLSGALRFVVAALLMLTYLLARRGRPALRATRTQLVTAVASGILLLAGGNGLVTIAEQRVSSGLVALLIACTPLWIVVLRALLRDRPGPATALGVLVGLGGVALIFLPGGSGETDLAYAALCVLAALCWSVGSLLVTLRPVPPDPLMLTTVQMFAGGLVLLVASLGRDELAGFSLGAVPGRSWVALAYLVVFGSLIAFTAYVWLLGNAPVSIVATYAYVNPAVAVLLGALVAGERLTGSALAGGLVVLAAVALVVTAESRDRLRAAEPKLSQGSESI